MDVKRLRAQLMDEYPPLTKRMLDKVLPKDSEVNLLKCSNGTSIYVPGDGPPAFFDDGFGAVYPTLFTLWKLPPFMPQLVTHGPVSKFLLPKERSAGADMMLPGVIVPDEGLGSFKEGQKRCMMVQGNDMPFAVGRMLVSDADITRTGMKDKGMAILHVYRDSLWTYGGRKARVQALDHAACAALSTAGIGLLPRAQAPHAVSVPRHESHATCVCLLLLLGRCSSLWPRCLRAAIWPRCTLTRASRAAEPLAAPSFALAGAKRWLQGRSDRGGGDNASGGGGGGGRRR